MAKAYTRTGYSAAPSISLALAAGGSLKPNTTYYYRAMTASNYTGGMTHCSALSAVQSITTDTTNLSVVITLTHSTGNSEYFYIWVSEGVDPGTGNWAKPSSTTVSQLGTASTSVYATSFNVKGTTYTDTGTRNSFMTIGTSNYGMYLPHENAQDYITLSGGTSSDPVTLENLYQYALANSWDLTATIDRVNYGRPGAGDDDSIAKTGVYGLGRPTYIINAKTIVYSDYVKLKDLNVISLGRNFTSNQYGVINIGEYNETMDLTYDGIDWTSFVHSSQAGSIQLRSSGTIYDSKFRSRRMAASVSTPYASTFGLIQDFISYQWKVVDVSVGSEFDRGMGLSWGPGGNTLLRVKNYQNRWDTNTFTWLNGNISDWSISVYDSGPWLRTNTTENKEMTIRNMKVRINAAGNLLLYVTPYHTGVTYYSMVNLIDADLQDADLARIYWFTSAALIDDRAFVKLYYSFNLNVVDEDGNPIEDATVTITDVNEDEAFSETTDSNGDIDEQFVLNTLFKPSLTLTTSHYQPDGRTTYYGDWVLTIEKTGYETIRQPITIDKATELKVALRKVRRLRIKEDGVMLALNAERGSDALLKDL